MSNPLSRNALSGDEGKITELPLPLWVGISIQKFWTKAPLVRVVLLDGCASTVSDVRVKIEWADSSVPNLDTFISVRLCIPDERGYLRQPQVYLRASLSEEGSDCLFWDAEGHQVASSKWGPFLCTSAIFDNEDGMLAELRGWPFLVTRKVFSGEGLLVAMIRRYRRGDMVREFSQKHGVGQVYMFEPSQRVTSISSVVVADWICSLCAAYGGKPDASPL